MSKPLSIAAISWSNDFEVHNRFFRLSFEAAPWYGNHKITPIVILPHDNCKNLGEAYNLGRRRANTLLEPKPDIYIYMHQDVQLQDRTLGNKLRGLLWEGSGIGAVGPLGATIDTGGGYWFCAPKYQVGSSPDLNPMALVMVSEARPLKVLDGIFLATNQNIEWSEEYDSVHMFIEDYCMRVRAAGLDVFAVDTWLLHRGGGAKLDNKYWHSNELFRRNWGHMFSNEVPPWQLYKAFMDQYNLHDGVVHRKIVQAGMYQIVWDTWARRVAEQRREAERAKKDLELVHG